MVPKPMSLKRQAERARLRRGPAWRVSDFFPLLTVLLTGVVTVFYPALMADLGDSVLGSNEVIPSIGISASGLFQAGMRGVLVALIGWMLWHVRQAPLNQRWAWAGVGVGVLMNYARNVYSGNPATVSFVLVQISLCWLCWRLTLRPTIHQQLQTALERAEKAEAKLAEEEK